MSSKKVRTVKRTECYDGICVTGAKGYDSELNAAVKRRTAKETDDDNFITVRKYNIRGQVFTVRSFFGKSEKRTSDDVIRRLIDTGEKA